MRAKIFGTVTILMVSSVLKVLAGDCKLVIENVTRSTIIVEIAFEDVNTNSITHTINAGGMYKVAPTNQKQYLKAIHQNGTLCQPREFRLPVAIANNSTRINTCLAQIQVRNDVDGQCYLIKK